MGLNEFLERILGKFKSITDLSLEANILIAKCYSFSHIGITGKECALLKCSYQFEIH